MSEKKNEKKSKKKRKWRIWHVLLAVTLISVIAAVAAYQALSRPLPESILPAGYEPDLANGARMYHLGGCISCHRGIGPNVNLPAGGRKMIIPSGTIHMPNITPDAETGIGNWRPIDFVNAMRKGLSPDGAHYIPAFPYTSFAWMRTEDLLDLFAYLKSLKPVRNKVERSSFWLERRLLAFWKWLALPPRPFRPVSGKSALWNRGAYLVLGPGHCAECHTPRNAIFLLNKSRWLAGAPHPVEKGHVPSLRRLKERGRYKDVNDLMQALKFGEALGHEDISSGGMGEVQSNLAKLPDEDLRAIATYLMSLK